VQFPHPGGEHNPRIETMPWNVEDHRRKFLQTRGRHLDKVGRLTRAELVLWGEWEPPSDVVRRWPSSGRLPRALHRPSWGVPHGAGFRQNTDPWVWGDEMFYSCCKQTVGPENRPTSMQGLTPGSVICFGSTIDREFCLDTVLVVASSDPWVAADADEIDASEAFLNCTVASVATSPEANVAFTLYRGATIDNPVGGMFSFVPARLADDANPRFPRPAVELPGLINPASRQSTWGSKRPLSIGAVRDAWCDVRDQVLDAGLELAVALDTPRRDGATEPVRASTRGRC
jgi:hypothetical protein